MTLLRRTRRALVAVAALIATGGWWAPASEAQSAPVAPVDSLRIRGLTGAVEVRRDRWGVPHIYARNQRDLFFAQGFVAAHN